MMLDQVRWIPAAMQANLLSLFAPEFNGGGEPRIAARLRVEKGRRPPAAGIASRGDRARVADRRDRPLAGPDAGPADAAREDEQPHPRRRHNDLRGMDAEVLAQERADGTTGGHASRSADIQQAFERLSFGDADFAYVLHFSEIGVKGPKLGFGLGFYGVLVDVTKYRLVFRRGPAHGFHRPARRPACRRAPRPGPVGREYRSDRFLRTVGTQLDELDAESGRGDRRSRHCRVPVDAGPAQLSGTLRRLVHDLLRRP